MTLVEIKDVLDQLADAGVLFLTLSGGEVLMRMDFFEILRYARRLQFCVKIKTNGFMIREKEADLMRELGVQEVRISIYSHRAEIHDAITKLPGSLKRAIAAIRLLKSRGLTVAIGNVLMHQNIGDYASVKKLGDELGVPVATDPTITPKMDGNRSILQLGIRDADLKEVMHDLERIDSVQEFSASPDALGDSVLDTTACSAGHTYCYISPYGEIYPCVQFPLPCGNVRKEKFLDIWRNSTAMNDVRSIRARDLPTCSSCTHVGTCTRCPGLAFMEGDMRGASSLDCEKSFARTGIPSANMIKRQMQASAGMSNVPARGAFSGLVQIAVAGS
jgi:radical SAM protein with 4Fe4S-binding SPASM domain